MDHTAFWNIVPNLALFILTLGMIGFTLVDYGYAHRRAAEAARVEAQPSREVPQTAAA